MTGLARWIATALVMVILGGPSIASAGINAPPTATAETSPPVAKQGEQAPAADTQQYAQREQQATNLQTFKGGGAGIYIGSTTVIIILLVVLIVILL